MPLKPEDYEAIRNLYGRYSIASDSGDAEAFAACFTPDATNSFDGLPAHLGRNGTQVGREAIRALCIGIFAGGRGHLLHIEVPQTIEGNDDEARVVVYAVVLRRGQAPYSGVILTATGQDTLVRSADGWQFKTRVGHMDVSPPDAETTSSDVLVMARDKFVDAVLKSYAKA